MSKVVVKLHAADFSVDKTPQSGTPVKVDSDQIKISIENNCYTMWEIADIFKISRSSSENHLYQLGYVKSL